MCVFHHISSREIIESYLRGVHRLLVPGGLFKFEVQGCTAVVPGRGRGNGTPLRLPTALPRRRRRRAFLALVLQAAALRAPPEDTPLRRDGRPEQLNVSRGVVLQVPSPQWQAMNRGGGRD